MTGYIFETPRISISMAAFPECHKNVTNVKDTHFYYFFSSVVLFFLYTCMQ